MSNRITERNEQGQIISNELSSEAASVMGKKRWDKERLQTVEGLLDDAGLTLETAPNNITLWCQKSLKSDSSGVAALDKLQKALRDYKEQQALEAGASHNLVPGDLCPYCLQYYEIELSRRLLEQLIEATGGQLVDKYDESDNYA